MAGNKKPAKKYSGSKVQSGVLLSQQNQRLDGTYTSHKSYVNTYRSNIMRVLNDIENGTVDEDDVFRLRNFCQWALASMERQDMREIDKAWRNAEAMSILHHDMNIPLVQEPLSLEEQHRVVLDPKKQNRDQQ